jgi:hypothetical protein
MDAITLDAQIDLIQALRLAYQDLEPVVQDRLLAERMQYEPIYARFQGKIASR